MNNSKKKNALKREEHLEIYVDGASRGNQGPSAYAFIFIKKEAGQIHKGSGFLGEQTNNISEYMAIINALRAAEKFTQGNVKLYSDSQLVIKQINKEYQAKAGHLIKLRDEVYRLRSTFEKVEFFNVRRNHPNIQACDALCNKCLDENI